MSRTPRYRTTNFKMEIRRRRWTNPVVIERWARAREELAERDRDPKLRKVDLPPRTLDRWMTGEVGEAGPRAEAARILEYMLQRPVAWLFQTYDPELAEHPPSLPELIPSASRSARVSREGDTASPSLTGWDSPDAILRMARDTVASNTDPEMLVVAREAVRSIVDRYELGGPQQLAGEARLLRRMLGVMLRGRQTPAQRRELFALAAQASGLLAYMAVNDGRSEVAEALCTEADQYAREADEVRLRIWVAGTRALNFYYAKEYVASDAAAVAGIGLAPRDPQAIRLLVNGRARALARLGDAQQAHRMVEEALALSMEHDVVPGLTSCISFAPYGWARTTANAVTAYLSAGDLDRVVLLAQRVEALTANADSPWTRSLVGLDVATALLRRPGAEVEEAMRVATEALNAGGVPIKSVRQRAGELLLLAHRWRGMPVVRDYAAQLKELS